MTQQFPVKIPNPPLRSDNPLFNHHITFRFEDTSEMSFNGAFFELDEYTEIISVYTEHCGYFGLNARSVEEIIVYKLTKEESLPKIFLPYDNYNFSLELIKEAEWFLKDEA